MLAVRTGLGELSCFHLFNVDSILPLKALICIPEFPFSKYSLLKSGDAGRRNKTVHLQGCYYSIIYDSEATWKQPKDQTKGRHVSRYI